MVFDDVRNAVYSQAIRGLVTPDSVVLDLGAGLGVHGLFAAATGAKRVYLVEPEPVIQIVGEIARANGLDDKIVVLEGRIEDVELPEQVDIIISVFTGNLLYTEDLLPSLFLARDRYLKPGGRMLPDFAELMLAPVSAPGNHDKYIGRWAKPSLDLNFSSGRRFASNETLGLRREELKAELLAPGTALAAVDLKSASEGHCEGEALYLIETSGICHGLLGWIRIRLGDKWLSTDPASPEVHWAPVLLPLDPPLTLETGEEIAVTLRRPARGDWTWTVKAQSGDRRHSTFLARADGPRRLRKMAASYHPKLNAPGKNALHVLTMIQAGKNNQEIAQALVEIDQTTFPEMEVALEMVQSLVLRYAKND